MARRPQGIFAERKGINPSSRSSQQAAPRTPLGKSRKELRFRRPQRQTIARRTLRRTQPVARLSLHARSRLGRRLPQLFLLGDHFDGMLPHLGARDVTFTAISRAPMPQIAAFKKRMGWKFNWVSSNANSFNFDYKVSLTPEEIATGEANYNFGTISLPIEECPGASAFYKDEAGNVYHTYSTYARGLDIFLGAYNFLDIAPKGRDEDGLAFTMAWVKHHDKYTGQDVV